MPIYVYQCSVCLHGTEEFERMSDAPRTRCPKCLRETYKRVPQATHSDMQEFHKPIEMQSLGLAHRDEIQAFRKRNPGIEISDDPKHPQYGVPIARSRKEKLTILKNEGYVEKK